MTNLGNYRIMSQNLKKYISDSGKTQKEIADLLNIPTSTLNDWVKGNRYPRIDKIEMLAKIFKCMKSDLIEEHNEEWVKEKKKNNDIKIAVDKMKKDDNFLSVVNMVGKLDADKLAAVQHMLSTIV